MCSKRKRVVLSMSDKEKIIDALNKGVSGKLLAQIYNVGTSTISDIKRNSSSIKNFLEREDRSSSRKMMKTAENNELEEAVFTWYLQQRTLGLPLSGPIICNKAKMFAQKIDGLSEFKASNGWLRNFKARHGIREFDSSGEKHVTDKNAADTFIQQFKNEIKTYDPEFVYNADETCLNWKELPSTTFISQKLTAQKDYKERLTLLTCANLTGSHRIPLLLIGKSKNPRPFKNVKIIPLVYKNQTLAWMTATVFTEWYDEVFIPEVKKFQKELGKKQDVLLFVDDAPTHPSESLLERENGHFKVLFWPSYVASLLQPMEQGIIECLKRHYRRQLLQKLLLAGQDKESVLAYYKKIDLKDFSYMIADSWYSIKNVTLKRAWNNINGISIKEQIHKVAIMNIEEKVDEEDVENESEQDVLTKDIQNIIVNIPGFSECSADDINRWLQCDSVDPRFQTLNDDEILGSLIYESQKGNNEEFVTVKDEIEEVPTASEAFACFDTALKWMEQQPECDYVQLLTLNRLRNLAACKRVTSEQ